MMRYLTTGKSKDSLVNSDVSYRATHRRGHMWLGRVFVPPPGRVQQAAQCRDFCKFWKAIGSNTGALTGSENKACFDREEANRTIGTSVRWLSGPRDRKQHQWSMAPPRCGRTTGKGTDSWSLQQIWLNCRPVVFLIIRIKVLGCVRSWNGDQATSLGKGWEKAKLTKFTRFDSSLVEVSSSENAWPLPEGVLTRPRSTI